MRKSLALSLSVLAGVLLLVFSLCARANAQPAPTVLNGDVNGDGSIDISDPVFLLLYLFQSGKPLAVCSGAEALSNCQAELSTCQADLRACRPPQPSYTVTDLGVLNLGCSGRSSATAINESGDVAGFSSCTEGGDGSHGFLWRNGLLTDLGKPPGGGSVAAWGMSDNGQIVGSAFRDAFLWKDGVLADLGPPEGIALAVNNAGLIAGYGAPDPSQAFEPNHALVWKNGKAMDLGFGDNSRALAVNNFGQVVSVTSAARAFLWENGVTTDLGTLGGPGAYANAINDLGQVAGTSTDATGARHVFLWEHGVMTDVDDPIAAADSTLTEVAVAGINDHTEIVGSVSFRDCVRGNFTHAVIWKTGERKRLDLNNLIPPDSGWELWSATGINNAGQIVGYGYLGGPDLSHQRGFLLTPAH